jgi:hypothetical protein
MILTVPENCNYVEIIVKPEMESMSVKPGTSLTSIPMSQFVRILDKIKMARYFKKHTKCYKYGNLTYSNAFNEDIKVTAMNTLHVDNTDKDIMVCYGKKEKQPYHMFPSSKSLDSCFYSKKLVFRFHNRVYLNFETVSYIPRIEDEEHTLFKVYINYNHDTNVDIESIRQCVQSILFMINLGVGP